MKTPAAWWSKPAEAGYSMPAEWEPHEATWLAWPHNRETWPRELAEVQNVWVAMIRVLSEGERVHLLIDDADSEREVAARLQSAGVRMDQVSFFRFPTVDVWMRDYGPTFLTRAHAEQPLAMNDWIFNGWGGKYHAYEQDDRIARDIAAALDTRVFAHRVVLEGGSIEVNGSGVCLTTEQCLLHKNRNPRLSRAEIVQLLKDSLGVAQIVWLGEGIAGDDTDGHIDDIARFVSAGTVVCALEKNPRDENYRTLQANYERLQGARDLEGKKFSIIPLPCPEPVCCEGVRLPASYANFYIANNAVLVPTFGDGKDGEALGILGELFPGRKVAGFPCAPVVAGLGAIHCVTQQQPKVSPRRA